jgi:hypothetical protein
MFPKLSAAKLEEGVFVGPDTRKIMQSQEFSRGATFLKVGGQNF